jgi:hypothetical protein
MAKKNSSGDRLPCPECGHMRSKVLDSRAVLTERALRRRRQCLECGFRYSTDETIRDDYAGKREPDVFEIMVGLS